MIDDPTPATTRRRPWRDRVARWRVWVGPFAALVVAVIAAVVLWQKMRHDTWAYYTDGAELRAEAGDGTARPVLWEDPEPQSFDAGEGEPAAASGGRLEAAFAADGATMLLVRRESADRGADIFLSRWDGRRWSRPEAVAAVNTPANERGPALSRDGRFLFFASDRAGGRGGYDLYVARWDGSRWAGVEPLPDTVNTAADEHGPALAPDGARLFFSSDRNGGSGEDIFVSALTVPEAPGPGELAPVPECAAAAPVDTLNSKAADLEAAMTARGDHLFLASDRERTSRHGFKVYFSRVIDGEALAPEEVDLYLPGGDATDPAVRMDGFDLLFSARDETAREAAGEVPGYELFRSTTREVFAYTDLSRWVQFKELMKTIRWWLVLAVAALLAVLYLLEKWQDLTSVFHRCLAGSVLLHLLALLLTMAWLITREISEEPEGRYVEIAIDALTEEELALESIPEETEITETPSQLAQEKVEAEFGAPGFEAPDEAQPVPEAARPDREAVVEARPALSEPAAAPAPETPPASSILSDLAPTALPEIETSPMEERDPSEAPAVADATKATFAPESPRHERSRAPAEAVADRAAESEAEAPEVPVAPSQEAVDFPELPMVEAAVTPAAPELSPSPLVSEILRELPPEPFADPGEAPLEEPAAAATPADPSQDTFAPGDAVPKLATAPAPAEARPDAAAGGSGVAEAVPPSRATSGESAVETVTASPGEASPSAELPSAVLSADLPDLAMESLDAPPLEEGEAAAGAPADPARDLFEPAGAAPNLATAPAPVDAHPDAAVGGPAVVEVEPTPTRGGPAAELVAANPGEAIAADALPASTLATDLPGLAMPSLDAPRLEEGDRAAGAPADTDAFEPAGARARLATAPARPAAVADTAGDREGATAESARVTASSVAPAPAVEVRPVLPPAAAERPPAPGGLAARLPDLPVLDPGRGPPMEEPSGQAAGGPADPARDRFVPGGRVGGVRTAPAAPSAVADTAATDRSETASVPGGRADPVAAAVDSRPAAALAGSEASLPGRALAPGDLPATAPLDPGAMVMEEPAATAGRPADANATRFAPRGAVALVTKPVATAAGREGAVAGTVETSAIRAASPGHAAPGSGRPIESATAPMLPGGPLVVAVMPVASPGGVRLPAKLEAPKDLPVGEIAKLIQKQRGKPGLETIKQMGGSDGTEGAIRAAIEWLVENQEDDGRWDTRKHGAKLDYDAGGTGLALLCFYGWGERHDRDGKYRGHIRRALDWLLAEQDAEGYLGGRPGMMYSHAIATIALCEAYGLTRDPALREPAGRAIAWSLAAQSKSRGGWRYHPGEDADLSVTGWQYMALHSARMAGLDVPDAAFEKVRGFLDRVGGGKHGGLYGYQGRSPSPAMVATGMFCRQLDLVAPGDPMMRESARFLKMRRMDAARPDHYFVYYATLALYQHQGPVWLAWNERLKEILPLIQVKTGGHKGSWEPSRNITADGGRVVSTTLATLSLEVYYRLLPMYGFRNTEADPPAAKERGN